jgi:GntR family transcriptional regulator/MocR family aminotransferase
MMSESSRFWSLFVALDRNSRDPLRWQLAQKLREAVREGRLPVGSRLPSSRALAEQLSVSRGVVTDAYAQLQAEGFVAVRQGMAPLVRQSAPDVVEEAVRVDKPRWRYDMAPSTPALDLFPRQEWVRSVRRVVAQMADLELDYGDPFGVEALRRPLAEYLVRVRGVSTSWGSLAITLGFTQGLYLVCRAIRTLGWTRVAVEDPSLDDQWDTVVRAGLELVPIPVDERGLVVERLEEAGADAVIVTPAHQFPTGAVLAPERRQQLALWATSARRLIIEDDYDAEFRYDRAPVGTLQGLIPDRVVYLGTASKTLAPALRLGWAALPARLVEAVAAEKWSLDSGAPAIEQHAFADLLTRGVVDRHLRRTRREYRARRDELVGALTEQLGDCEIGGIAAGLHLTLRLAPGTDEQAVVDAAGARSLRVRGLADYRLRPAPDEPGLVLGYGNLATASVAAATSLLADSVKQSAIGRGRVPRSIEPSRAQ